MSFLKNKMNYFLIGSIACYIATYIGYLKNEKELTLFLEWIYFIGIVGTLIWLVWKVIQLSKNKNFRENTHIAFSALLFFGIVVMVYLIANNQHKLIDVTKDQKYSLSEISQNILKDLEGSIEIFAFMQNGMEGYQQVEQLLQQYAYLSEKITYKMVNPQKRPDLTELYGIERFGELVLVSGETKEKVAFPEEEQITNAILKLTQKDEKIVYFLSGHNEGDLTSQDQDGYSQIAKQLNLQNYIQRDLVLLREEKVPDDADAVIVLSPKTDLFDSEVASLKEYFHSGGSLLVLVDPGVQPTLKTFLEEQGFILNEGMMVDSMSQMFGASFLSPVMTQYVSHPITKNFRVACFFPTALMVDVTANPIEGYQIQSLGYTGNGSWLETDQESLKTKPEYNEATDILGPVSLAAVSEKVQLEEGEKGGRLVVFGDSSFISNNSLGMSGNKDLFMNTVSWLMRDENLISIRKKQTDSIPLLLTPPMQVATIGVSLVFLPFGFLLFGIIRIVRLNKEK